MSGTLSNKAGVTRPAWASIFLCIALLSIWPGVNQADDQARQFQERAEQALRDKNYDEAIQLAGSAINAQPEGATGYLLRARVSIALGKSQEAIADIDRLLRMNARQPRLLEIRGTENFKLRRFEQAIADFDQECKLDPARDPWHWKRGLAYYYAGQYAKGRDQFQRYHDRDDDDVENAVWRVLCMARMKDVGLKEAQEKILVVKRDPRVPMMEVYQLFAGKAKPDDVLRAIQRDQLQKSEQNSRMFYGHLYLGLYYDLTGEPARAIEELKTAVDHPIDHFMWDLAKVHLSLLEQPLKARPSGAIGTTRKTEAD